MIFLSLVSCNFIWLNKVDPNSHKIIVGINKDFLNEEEFSFIVSLQEMKLENDTIKYLMTKMKLEDNLNILKIIYDTNFSKEFHLFEIFLANFVFFKTQYIFELCQEIEVLVEKINKINSTIHKYKTKKIIFENDSSFNSFSLFEY